MRTEWQGSNREAQKQHPKQRQVRESAYSNSFQTPANRRIGCEGEDFLPLARDRKEGAWKTDRFPERKRKLSEEGVRNGSLACTQTHGCRGEPVDVVWGSEIEDRGWGPCKAEVKAEGDWGVTDITTFEHGLWGDALNEKIMQWDDSGAMEAYMHSVMRRRHRTYDSKRAHVGGNRNLGSRHPTSAADSWIHHAGMFTMEVIWSTRGNEDNEADSLPGSAGEMRDLNKLLPFRGSKTNSHKGKAVSHPPIKSECKPSEPWLTVDDHAKLEPCKKYAKREKNAAESTSRRALEPKINVKNEENKTVDGGASTITNLRFGNPLNGVTKFEDEKKNMTQEVNFVRLNVQDCRRESKKSHCE